MLPATQNNGLTTTSTWGSEGTSSKDLVIPKIQIAQANSNVCKEGHARPGDLVHSTSKAVLAAKGTKLQILPILCIGSWVVTTPKPPGGGFPEFIRKEPLTPENDSDRWKIEGFEDSKPIVHNKSLTFLGLLVDHLKSFPFFIEFQATNKAGGKVLSTIIQENGFKGLPAPARVVELSTSLKNYKQNSWFILGVTPCRGATAEELSQCKKWYDLFSQAKLKESDEDEDNGIS